MIVASLPYPAFVGPGPELVTNGQFSSGTTGWTSLNASASVVGGQAQEVESTTAAGRLYQAITTEIGATYTISYTLTAGSASSTATVQVGNAAATAVGSGLAMDQSTSTTARSGSFTFVATNASTFVQLIVSGGAGKTALFDNISVKRTA